MKRTALFSGMAALLLSGTCLASPINSIASDDFVQDMVSRIASQSPSGDPTYCSFDKPTEVSFKGKTDEFQVQIGCGSGTEKQHMTDRKIYVKAIVDSTGIYVTGLQVGKKF